MLHCASSIAHTITYILRISAHGLFHLNEHGDLYFSTHNLMLKLFHLGEKFNV